MSLPQLVHDVRAAHAVKRDRLIRLQAVLALAGVGKSTWYGLCAKGQAPQCVRVTPRCVAWSENEVLAWLQARIDEARNGQAQLDQSGAAQ